MGLSRLQAQLDDAGRKKKQAWRRNRGIFAVFTARPIPQIGVRSWAQSVVQVLASKYFPIIARRA